MDDGAQVEFLGGDHGKALVQVETHLPAKNGAGAGTGPVGFHLTVVQHMAHEVQILLHGRESQEIGNGLL